MANGNGAPFMEGAGEEGMMHDMSVQPQAFAGQIHPGPPQQGTFFNLELGLFHIRTKLLEILHQGFN